MSASVRSVEDIASAVLRRLDREGRELPVPQWVELLERMTSEVRERLDAAREDARRG